MKKFFFITIVLQSFLSIAQNLVLNPSFENYTSCPTGSTNDISKAIGWSSYNQTPDYFNLCSSSASNGVGIPSNWAGHQFSHTGNAYSGIIIFDKAGFYREAIGSQLAMPLIIGQKYYVSFYTCLTIKTPNNAFAANNLGAKFTNSTYSANAPNQISSNNTAQMSCNTTITDTTNWVQVTGSFIADSTYQYIAIGNFFDDAHTDTSRRENMTLPIYAYYYIDDVCVSTDSVYANTWATGIKSHTESEQISIYPNPAQNSLHITISNDQTAEIKIYDVLGKEVINTKTQEIDVSSLQNGIYFIQAKTSEGILSKKVVVQH